MLCVVCVCVCFFFLVYWVLMVSCLKIGSTFSPSAISFESVQSFIEGGDEPVPKLPDHLTGVKRYAIISHFIFARYAEYKNCCLHAFPPEVVERREKFLKY